MKIATDKARKMELFQDFARRVNNAAQLLREDHNLATDACTAYIITRAEARAKSKPGTESEKINEYDKALELIRAALKRSSLERILPDKGNLVYPAESLEVFKRMMT